MGILSFFQSRKIPSTPDRFEKELTQLELKIERHQDRLQSIRIRQRSTTSKVTNYSLGFWFIYSILSYLGLGPFNWLELLSFKNDNWNHAIQFLPIILIPIALLFVRQIFQSWYQRKQESEQIQLRQLQKQLRDKVEELKNKTSYYSTKELLERYDEKLKKPIVPTPSNSSQSPSSATTPNSQLLRQRLPNSPSTRLTTPIIPNTSSPLHHLPTTSQDPRQVPLPPSLNSTSQRPSSPSGRGWADRFAEVLLGDDEARPESKYALICIRCLAHNGLVLKEELNQIQYLCPKCGAFNPSKNKRADLIQSRQDVNDTTSSDDSSPRGDRPKMAIKNKRTKPPEVRQSLGGPLMRDSSITDSLKVPEKKRAVSLAGAPFKPVPESDIDQQHDHKEDGMFEASASEKDEKKQRESIESELNQSDHENLKRQSLEQSEKKQNQEKANVAPKRTSQRKQKHQINGRTKKP
ncbi:hypothetical protein O181_025545 [Austropuccinia psidii MF-1]|uniref:Endoplasmic reticulum junction formation protein lunapark n=1 Tax=Austropuccinia psidii MF-1 TaxID=1389203 RepID=A0A9Q3H194_9BASI|nr:hypothetical protein [Austropuccinia psidii MF-1]